MSDGSYIEISITEGYSCKLTSDHNHGRCLTLATLEGIKKQKEVLVRDKDLLGIKSIHDFMQTKN